MPANARGGQIAVEPPTRGIVPVEASIPVRFRTKAEHWNAFEVAMTAALRRSRGCVRGQTALAWTVAQCMACVPTRSASGRMTPYLVHTIVASRLTEDDRQAIQQKLRRARTEPGTGQVDG